jgi:hypothetical protein
MLGSSAVQAGQAEFKVYEVRQALSLGGSHPTPPKEYYVSLGADQGVKAGTTLEVYRRSSTYDLAREEFYRDVLFPIAHMKVIHVDLGAAICRLEKFLPTETTPVLSPPAIMVGDIVRPMRSGH